MENITELVNKTGLSRQEVAKALGCSTAMLRNYERGNNPIPDKRLGILQALAGAQIRTGPDTTPATASLAMVPAAELITELNRRAVAGQLRDTITRPGTRTRNSDARFSHSPYKPLRAVATDMTEDD